MGTKFKKVSHLILITTRLWIRIGNGPGQNSCKPIQMDVTQDHCNQYP